MYAEWLRAAGLKNTPSKIKAMKHYLVVDKTNRIVRFFRKKEDAEDFVSERPYLRVSEFDDSINDESNTDAKSKHSKSESEDLPF